MKKMINVLLLLSLTTPVPGLYGQQDISVTFEKLMWLEGKWDRTNGKAGQVAHERWEKSSSSNSELQGFGVTKRDADTVFMEKLRILTVRDSLFYVADVPENQKPVYFFIKEIGASHFICENPNHDFPKKIAYRRLNNEMYVTVSGNGKSIDFVFRK